MRRGGKREIELRRSAVGMPGSRHGENARAVMQQRIVHTIVLELAFNSLAGSAGAVAAGVAALNDKPRLIAVKGQSVIESSLGKLDKVCGRERRVVLSELGDDDTLGGVEGCGMGHVGFSWIIFSLA
jgi:hypothetical protein